MRSIADVVQQFLEKETADLRIAAGQKLPYAHEILTYKGTKPYEWHTSRYETDLLIYEYGTGDVWKPRVIIEAKIHRVTTHDAITYSQKAGTHKQVHPYIRYGILLGHRKHYPLPGRLIRHGALFDFMLSWQGFTHTPCELQQLRTIISQEVEASRQLEEMLFNSRSRNREHFTYMHKRLRLE